MQVVICEKKYDEMTADLKKYYGKISADGCFFAIVTTEYDACGNVVHDFLEVINFAAASGYVYVNTIVYPAAHGQKVAFTDNVKYVVWFCKDLSRMKFNKDPVREKHIWKDVEWGKRAKNYNPKGKDPGNVWIPTIDDGRANIVGHILLTDDEVIEKILAMTCCGDDYKLLRKKCRSVDAVNVCRSASRVAENKTPCAAKVVFASSENMSRIEDDTVTVAVTSPPYWNLKDYFKKGQIGQEPYEKYLARLYSVWEECHKKLNSGGTLWVNVNIRHQKGNVIPIPYNIVEQCKKIGFYYKGILIWHKSSGIPTGEKNIVDRHEYVLLFAKAKKYSANHRLLAQIADYKNDAINGGAFWNINRKAGSVGKKYIHPAIYPNELAERIVRIASAEKEIVMDPFLGSGTSLIAALRENRDFVGYEYNEGFAELMQSRFKNELPLTENIEYIYDNL